MLAVPTLAAAEDVISEKFGTSPTVAAVVGGGAKAIKGIQEGEADKAVQGAITAATPWLMSMGPLGMGVAGLNVLWDLFD